VLDVVFAGASEFETFVAGGTVTGDTSLTLAFAGAFASTLALVFAGASVVVVSGLLERTELSPVSAGIESIRAESIKTVAVTMVVFDKTVAVPRDPKALLDVLLVKSAPASDLPG